MDIRCALRPRAGIGEVVITGVDNPSVVWLKCWESLSDGVPLSPDEARLVARALEAAAVMATPKEK